MFAMLALGAWRPLRSLKAREGGQRRTWTSGCQDKLQGSVGSGMWRRQLEPCPAATVKVVLVMSAWERREVDYQLSLPSALLKLNFAVSYFV